MVDIDEVKLEDASRSHDFTRGYGESPEEKAKRDVDEWKGCEDEGDSRRRR